MNLKKVSVIGAGNVGSAVAFSLSKSGLFNDIAVVDIDEGKAVGEALDIAHGSMLSGHPARVYAGSYEEDMKDSDIAVITAGAANKDNPSRLALVDSSTKIFKQIVPAMMDNGFDGIIIVVANPVDIMTYVTYKLSGLPRERVIGTGTLLDTARFKYGLSTRLNVNPNSIEATVIGEHGDSSVATFSKVTVNGHSLEDYLQVVHSKELSAEDKEKLSQEIKDAGYVVFKNKGMTNYGIAQTVERICFAICRDENVILPVGSNLEGEYGLKDVALSVPALVNSEGAHILELEYTFEEINALKESAKILQDNMGDLDL